MNIIVQEVASEAARCRRQKELELEVLTGTVRGWEGEPIDSLGEIVKMGPVVVGTDANRLVPSFSNNIQKKFYDRSTNSEAFCACMHCECIYHPLPFYETQIINSFLTSWISANPDKGLEF